MSKEFSYSGKGEYGIRVESVLPIAIRWGIGLGCIGWLILQFAG